VADLRPEDPREAGEPIRAFLALELAPALRRAAAEVVDVLRRRPGGDGVRWVREEALHVTLRFLGPTDPARTPELARRVGAELREMAPLALRLGRPGAFPSPRRPRVIVLQVEPEAPLAALARAVERGVQAAGFEPERRPFRAHLTLGRAKRGAPDLRGVTVPDTAVADTPDVTEVVLFRSELRPSGARYVPLERIPLGASHHP
jgi:2'-5' RNA ligase